MLQNQYYNLIDAVVYLIAAIIPSYFILRSKGSINSNNHFRKLTVVLVGFILAQVSYHIAALMGFRLLATGFLEPLSMVALLFFSVAYLITTWKGKQHKKQPPQGPRT